jgi:hypothetical protein
MTYRRRLFPLIVLVIFLPVFAASGSEGKHEPMMKKDEHQGASAATRELNTLEDLKAEVIALRKAVEALQATQPSITSLMPEFAERFHIMHYAGDAGDWAVAAHEVLEMQRLVGVIERIDPEKGPLMKGFMTQSFNKLNTAIEHGNRASFDKALQETLTNCNACHKAVGSEFIKVTLEVDESLSMRHPHQLERRKMMGPHTHKH